MGYNLSIADRRRAFSNMAPGNALAPIATKPPRKAHGKGDKAEANRRKLERQRLLGIKEIPGLIEYRGHEGNYDVEWERQYGMLLLTRKVMGEIQSFDFEAIRLHLCAKHWYTPDFTVVTNDGRVEFHEVKGFWREAARLRFDHAREKFPQFGFIEVRKVDGQWVTVGGGK